MLKEKTFQYYALHSTMVSHIFAQYKLLNTYFAHILYPDFNIYMLNS